MDILQATKSYEQWMRQRTPIVEAHLRYKHEQMKDDLGLFSRGTFYRWAQLRPELCADLCNWQVSAAKQMAKAMSSEWRDYKKS
jgi:hypothetical protein